MQDSPTQPVEDLPVILFVDDEEKTCKHFKRLFRRQFRILLANDGVEALKVFQSEIDKIGIIVTDQRMPNETGTEFLQKAALLKPGVVRILSTAYADVDAAIDSVNKGGVYRYITKPWEVSELEVTLIRASELYALQEERDELHRQKMTSLQNLAATERIHSLAALAVFQNSGLRHVSRALHTLVELADQPQSGPMGGTNTPPQWSELYQQHRHFLEVAHAILPTDITSQPDLEPTQLVLVADLIKSLFESEPRFQWLESGESKARWPGPEESLKPIVGKLIDGISGILSQADFLSARESEFGIELVLSALSLQHGLQPLVVPNYPDGPEKNRCLQLTGAFMEWAHFGGTVDVLPDHASRTIVLRLSVNPPGTSSDAWEGLASDLVSNDLFWHRHIES